MIRGRNRIIEKVKDIRYIICYNSCYMLELQKLRITEELGVF